MPPPGWYGDNGNYQLMIHDVGSTFPTVTPFGEQFAGMRGGYIETTGAHALGGHVLEDGFTYQIICNTGCAGERNGEADGVPGGNKVELIAGTSVVASNAVSTTLDDFSETNNLEFIPDATHPNLGEPLKLRLTKTAGNWWYFVIWDNIKVYAIPPPPRGAVLIVR